MTVKLLGPISPFLALKLLLSFQLLLVMSFSERSYQELQFLVFKCVPSSEKTSVIFFGLDIARDNMLMEFIYFFKKC